MNCSCMLVVLCILYLQVRQFYSKVVLFRNTYALTKTLCRAFVFFSESVKAFNHQDKDHEKQVSAIQICLSIYKISVSSQKDPMLLSTYSSNIKKKKTTGFGRVLNQYKYKIYVHT